MLTIKRNGTLYRVELRCEYCGHVNDYEMTYEPDADTLKCKLCLTENGYAEYLRKHPVASRKEWFRAED